MSTARIRAYSVLEAKEQRQIYPDDFKVVSMCLDNFSYFPRVTVMKERNCVTR